MQKTKPVSKTELIDSVASKAGISKKDAHTAVNAVLDAVADFIKEGKNIVIPGFGTWKIRERGPRKVMNFKTKKMTEIPARKVVSFSISRTIKEQLNSNPADHKKKK
ncbi:MAG TPA: HU family DNA-binding protein [Thermodesulfobium narugense]|nr:HU family DNA-binding protein [Thermodesulfobium narugense]